MPKPAGRWKKPIARCICARRSGGTRPDRGSPTSRHPLDGCHDFRETGLSIPGSIMTAKPTPFSLRIPDTDIADLRERLGRTRFPDQAPGEAWAYGTDVSYLRDLTEYWRNGFDGRAEEAALNAFPQFRAALDDVDLHYLHVP